MFDSPSYGKEDRNHDQHIMLSDSNSSHLPGFDYKATSRLLRRIDIHLIPLLALLYLLSFLDRSNIGNARLAGLDESLDLKGLQFNNALAIFFPFYVTAEVPSNIMMKAWRPSLWIPLLMVVWGICCIGMGFVKNYAGLVVVRALLGAAEGGLFPGVAFYITMWYRRHECGFRLALFFSAATIAGAFGGLLARGIMTIDHKGGLRAWQWIFIIEGIITVVIGAFAKFGMYDYPDTASFLTNDEKREVARRLEEDRGSLADEFAWRYVWDAFKDWKIWIQCLTTVCIFTPLYSISLFLPSIVSSLGYDAPTTAQLMTVPPYVVACIVCIAAGVIEDRQRQRGLYQMGICLVGMVGFLMLYNSNSPHVKYAGTFLAAAGVYPNVPAVVAWNGNNIGGSTKRAVGIAMQVVMGNLGGVISGYSFIKRYAPHYYPGYGMLAGMSGVAALLSLLMTVYLRMENRRRDRMASKLPHEYSESEKLAERTLGDKASFFRFTV